jgi:hypothetical protein
MPPTPAVRLLTRTLALSLAAFSLACSDTATPVAPAAPIKPKLLEVPVVLVTNTDDSGTGSLRQAIAGAPDGAMIHFDAPIAGKTIVLSTGELLINKPLTIEGPVPAGITVSGGLSSRVFEVASLSGDVVFRNMSIVDGKDYDGGGIRNSGSKVIVDHSLVANNQLLPGKPKGGGIYSSGTASDLTLVNSTVSGNIGVNGGGITSDGILTIRNSTIVGNSSSQGGGILSFGTVLMRNSIIAYNIDRSDVPESPNCYQSSASSWTFIGLNITNDNSCGNDPALLITNWLLLGPLANNGGPTKTYALIAGTPAIDGTTDCTESTDQRYVARPKGAGCDVGAYEFDDYARITLVAGPNAPVNPKTGIVTLGGTITCTAPGSVSLAVALSQTQKTTGRFTTVVQASAPVTAACNTAASSWSVTLAPQTGGFENGSASATVQTTTVPVGFQAASVTAPIKLFSVK